MIVKPSVLEPHFSDILDIIYGQLGEGYTSTTELKHAIEYGNDRFVSVAFPDLESNPPCKVVHSPPPSAEPGEGANSLPDNVHKVPAAVTIGCVFNSSNLASHVNFPPNEYPPTLANTEPVGVLRGISIHEDATGQGIINETVSHTVDVLQKESCRVQCFLAWRGSGGVQFYDIFKQNGFKLRREFPDYWVEESLRKGYKCPECGNPPCECSALLFVRIGKSRLGL